MRALIVGAGVVGRATGIALRDWGHEVVLCEQVEQRREQLKDQDGFLVFSPETVPSSPPYGVALICVNTPTVEGRVDLTAVKEACDQVESLLEERLHNLTNDTIVIIRSTVPPGTTKNLEEGKRFSVCHWPEFLRATSAVEDSLTPRIVVIGAERTWARDKVLALFPTSLSVITVDSITAELIKYANNLYNATKISFTNEMGKIAGRLGVDSNTVMQAVSNSAEAMWNPTYGIRGGFPYGGACLPKDTVGFQGFAQDMMLQTPLLDAVIQVNESMETVHAV